MSDNTSASEHLSTARLLQIIVGVMLVGAVGFLVVAIAVQATGEGSTEEEPTTLALTYLAVGYAVLALILRGVAPDLLIGLILAKGSNAGTQSTDQHRQSTLPDSSFHRLYVTRSIICAALVEGAALLATLAYLIDGHILGLIVAAVLVGILAAHLPTKARINDWIARQRERQLQAEHFGT
jgi:hypothetical protein